MPLTLCTPQLSLRDEFIAHARDWQAHGDDRYAAAIADFDTYVRGLQDAQAGLNLPAYWVPTTTFWLTGEGQILGCSRLRHQLTPRLMNEGGHIGYDVRPSARRRGHGTQLLRLTLVEAHRAGITNVRITCDDDNVASKTMIEHAGGVFAGSGVSPQSGKRVLQYWIRIDVP
jgi:predicted acetyltransferase